MDKKKLLMMGAAVVTLTSLGADRAQAVVQNIDVNAVVLRAIALAQISQLDFGTFSVTAAGNIAIDDLGVVVNTGANQIPAATPNEARLQIKASKGFNLVVDAGTQIPLAIKNVPSTATVNLTALDLEGDTDADSIAVIAIAGTPAGASGTRTIGIGGTLTFVGGQTPGIYQDTFVVNVSYQ